MQYWTNKETHKDKNTILLNNKIIHLCIFEKSWMRPAIGTYTFCENIPQIVV